MKPEDLVFIGNTIKPYGLTGELKIKPSTFDLTRHELLEKVFFQKNPKMPIMELKVASSRLHQDLWFLRFEGHNTPESIKVFSGGDLFIHKDEKLDLPEEMVYTNDILGYAVFDRGGKQLGKVDDVMESPAQDLIVVNREGKESILIPWIDVFVNDIDKDKKQVTVDYSKLSGLYED